MAYTEKKCVSIDPELWRRFKRVAPAVNFSALVRALLTRWVKEKERR